MCAYPCWEYSPIACPEKLITPSVGTCKNREEEEGEGKMGGNKGADAREGDEIRGEEDKER